MLDSKFSTEGRKTMLTSPYVVLRQTGCLKFDMYMNILKHDIIFSLSVYTQRIKNDLIAKFIKSFGASWQKINLNLEKGSYHIVFEATTGIPYHSDISIDSINVETGECPNLIGLFKMF
ncbi:hypothetical protein A3Q56_01424 [Intoshia linei]|uniref:MAM domain-containing protein n=1 Tax=Intoshia linei TaxID=1819745 RepID=A0A177BB23_9BILA|nr:hypothetical protein A3Q56_01424 [Intoshia linei]